LAALIDRSTKPPQRIGEIGIETEILALATVPPSAANTPRDSNDPCSLRLSQSYCSRWVVLLGNPTPQHTAATLFPPPNCQRTTNKPSTRSVPMGRKSC